MFNTTSKGRYALKVMMDLCIHFEEQSPISRHGIASRQGISVDYIDQILARLRDAGLIESVRGRGGGFRLVTKPKDITLWDIFTAVEDTIYPVQCLDQDGCGDDEICISKGAWNKIFTDIRTVLQSNNLQDLTDSWTRDHKNPFPTRSSAVQRCQAPIKQDRRQPGATSYGS